MQKGEIVAAGTPLRLKAKYGAGYRLSLTSTSTSPESIRPPVPSATFESSAAGEVIWRIGDAGDLGRVVRWSDEMDRRNTGLRQRRDGEVNGSNDPESIQGWEISMPTLEEVLLEKKLF